MNEVRIRLCGKTQKKVISDWNKVPRVGEFIQNPFGVSEGSIVQVVSVTHNFDDAVIDVKVR